MANNALSVQPTMEPLRLNVSEAAVLIRVSRARFYELLNAGRIRGVRDGGRTYVLPADLRAYVDSCNEPYAPRIGASDGTRRESNGHR
jgi:excisionase family DNA binding protein